MGPIVRKPVATGFKNMPWESDSYARLLLDLMPLSILTSGATPRRIITEQAKKRQCKRGAHARPKIVWSSPNAKAAGLFKINVRRRILIYFERRLTFPLVTSSLASCTTRRTLEAMQRYLKNLWWADQNWPHMDFFMRCSASIRFAACWNLSRAHTHYIKA